MVSVAIIGGEYSGRSSLAAKLGKKGNVTDITMYDFAKGDQILTIIDSSGYPASPKPLMTALNMAEIVLLCIPPAGIDRFTGESIIATDLLGLDKGIIVQTMSDKLNPIEQEEKAQKIRSMLKGTICRNWEVVPISTTTFKGMEQLKESIQELDKEIAASNLTQAELPPRVVIDHSFNVKGIGSVVLGRVTRGTIHKYDKLTVYPGQQEIEIRNIQMHDVDKQSAAPGARVGLALKGIQAKEIERGYILSNQEIISDRLKLECDVSKFSPGLKINTTLHIFVKLQSVPVKVSDISIDGKNVETAPAGSKCLASFAASGPLAFDSTDVFIISDLNNPQQRFIARGVPI